MSKAVLVMDMPIDCMSCSLCHKGELIYRGDFLYKQTYMCIARPEEVEEFYLKDVFGDKPSWCPLRPVPNKKEVCGKYPQLDGVVPSFKIGYNACIDEILKE